MGLYVADFETTTTLDKTRVWAYAICDINNTENVIIGNTISEFINWCKDSKENDIIYFHNLKFDIQFIIYYLLKNGYEHVIEKKDRRTQTFTTLISDKGLFYSLEIIFSKDNKHINKVTFLDSYKLIPLSVDAMAKALHLPINKLSIDYDSHNNLPEGAALSEEEKDYITNDVKIVAMTIKYFKEQGLDKMTIGSCALTEYKNLISKTNFKKYFPTPKYHDDVKQSYRGGFTYLNPKFEGKVVKEGIVLDVNSLYPSVMRYEALPFGNPIFFEGKYKKDNIYPLYTQMFKCQFEIKKGKIPTIQIRYGFGFKANEYLTTSGNSAVILCLNNIDLELFFNQYDVYNIEYISGWKFKSTYGLFDNYIDKWSSNKIQAKKDGNHGLYLISKLFLNSLYGKFGTDTKVKGKIPYLEDDVVKYKTIEEKDREGVYIAMASFITSYARRKTILSAQKITDNYNEGKSNIQFIYADTDSLHCLSPGFKLPEGLDIDPVKLGAWKYESKFRKAKFLRQKCYIEDSTEDIYNDNPEYNLKITVAGMPKECYPYVNFKNFKIGASYKGKKQPKNTVGGVVLNNIDFTIKKV